MSETENMRVGSHTASVARLGVNAVHAMGRQVTGPLSPSRIAQLRSRLAHHATVTFRRVAERLPGRRYSVTTGVMFAADNRAFVCALIERVR